LVPRANLVDAAPSDDLLVERRGSQDLLDWLTTRYARAALPDQFNERLKAVGAEEQLRKALTNAPAVTEVYLLLKPRNVELEDLAVPYECDVVLLCKQDYLDQNVRLAIEPTVLEVERILAGVPGVAVGDVTLRGEHAFSRHEMREYDRWQFDDVSYAAAYRASKKRGDAPPPAYRAGLARNNEFVRNQ
jgi:hypothetical protein